MLERLQYSHRKAVGERILLIMLPPAGAGAAAFAEEGLVAVAQAGEDPVDVIAAHPDLALYLDGGIGSALVQQIVEPAFRQGYRRIWLLGISMGGMGALLFAAEHAELLERVILLAPFIGTRGTLAALAKAGGLAGTVPPPGIATVPEEKLLAWLRDYVASGRRQPAVFLGYGLEDRFAPGHRMLAENLAPDHVVALPGEHDWACWRMLLAALLASHPAPDWTAGS